MTNEAPQLRLRELYVLTETFGGLCENQIVRLLRVSPSGVAEVTTDILPAEDEIDRDSIHAAPAEYLSPDVENVPTKMIGLMQQVIKAARAMEAYYGRQRFNGHTEEYKVWEPLSNALDELDNYKQKNHLK